MRILVIGGTRFIGAAAVRRLHSRGHELAVLNRGRHPCHLPEDVERVHGDRDRLAVSRDAIVRFAPDVVLHNVVLNRRHAQDATDLFRGMVDRLVMVSSMDVYRAYGCLNGTEPGPLEPAPQDEDAPLRDQLYPYRNQAKDPSDPRWDYDKIPAEKVVLEDADLPGTVLRLPMVLGPGDYQHRLFALLQPMLDERRAIVLQQDYAHWKSTYAYVDNVGEAIARACLDERAAGRVYNVADGVLSTLELGGLVARAAGWEGEFVLVAREDLPDDLIVPWRVEQLLVGRADRIREELGHEPLIDMEEGVRHSVAWERENPPDPFSRDPLAYEAQDEVLARM